MSSCDIFSVQQVPHRFRAGDALQPSHMFFLEPYEVVALTLVARKQIVPE